MLNRPYIAYMRDAAGSLFRVAWALKPGGKSLPFPTVFCSSRFNSGGDTAVVDVGELRTEEFVPSPYAEVPARVCGKCFAGDQEWFDGTWPIDAEPVVLADDGFAVDCSGGCMGCVKSVGLAAAGTFVVTGSPVEARGTISLDWAPVPVDWILGGPFSGPDGEPSFRDPLTFPRNGSYLGICDYWTDDNITIKHGLGPFGLAMWTVTDGQVVFCTQQALATSDGPWVAHDSANWTRPYWYKDFIRRPVLIGALDQPGVLLPQPLLSFFIRKHDAGMDDGWFVDVDQVDIGAYRAGTTISMPGEFDATTLFTSFDKRDYSFSWFPVFQNTFFGGPVSGGSAVPTFRALDIADIPSGYPYSELSGAPGAVSVHSGTNVDVVESPTGYYTVNVATFPYADLTGVPTPPSVHSGTNVDVVESPTGYYTVNVATFPLTDCTGTLPASQVGSGYPYSDLTGAPSPPGPGSSTWKQYVLDYTDAITTYSGQPFFILDSIPANRIITRVISYTTSNWGNNFNPGIGAIKSTDLSMAGRYSGTGYGLTTDHGIMCYQRSGASVNNVEGDGTYSLAATLSTGLTPTSGHTLIYVEYSDL